jgi:type I restriction enzyme M protein
MPRGKKNGANSQPNNGANLGFEQTLWAAADKMRGHMDAAEYKHVTLGLIFLKYISDAFQELYDDLAARADTDYTDPEDRDEYMAENVFWVPKEARWSHIQASAKQPTIGKMIDEAMLAIEKENPKRLKGVLPTGYARPDLDKTRLGELIDLISTIGLGDEASRSKDILGRVYEYFLGQFAEKEGKGGGEFYTPHSVDWLIVCVIAPLKGRVYDPCFGSGSTLALCDEYACLHGSPKQALSIYGQESNATTWRLGKMQMMLRGIDANLGSYAADSFHNDLHQNLKADYIVAGPPFNMSDWWNNKLAEDVRWQYGTPPRGNANYGWVQHMVHHLAPNGMAGFVLANGSMSSNQSGEGEIRKALIAADLVDCMIALPGQLFYTTQIPACLWFLARDKSGKPTAGHQPCRNREGETLFIDARKLGVLIDRTHRELTEEEIARIAGTYQAWRGEGAGLKPALTSVPSPYEDVPGFCKSATLEEIASHSYVLTPGRYVGAEELEEDDEPFEEKMARLTKMLEAQFAESAKLEAAIRENLRGLGL